MQGLCQALGLGLPLAASLVRGPCCLFIISLSWEVLVCLEQMSVALCTAELALLYVLLANHMRDTQGRESGAVQSSRSFLAKETLEPPGEALPHFFSSLFSPFK